MLLNMNTEGKVLSKTWQTLKELAFVDRHRLSDEEIIWTETRDTDGQNLNPDLWRATVQAPGGRYDTESVFDARDTVLGDHTAKDAKLK